MESKLSEWLPMSRRMNCDCVQISPQPKEFGLRIEPRALFQYSRRRKRPSSRPVVTGPADDDRASLGRAGGSRSGPEREIGAESSQYVVLGFWCLFIATLVFSRGRAHYLNWLSPILAPVWPTIREGDRSILRRCSGPYVSWSAFYLCRPGLRFARGTGPRASSTTAA